MIFTIQALLRIAVLVLWASFALVPAVRAADPVGESGPADALRAAVAAYTPPAAAAAKQRAADAFFQFEGSALDRDLAARDPALYREIESRWMRLMATMEGGASQEAVQADGAEVVALLERGHGASQQAGKSVFFDSFLIILREGFEAILIVSALAAYLARIGERSRAPYLYGGAGLAVGASVLLWVAARSFLDLSGARREALEGYTVLLAAAVLFWVSYWLVSKAEADRWQAFVKSRVERAVGRGALVGLGFLSFVVVFREGFETVLFYEAVAARATGPSGSSLLLGGFLSGCVALGLFYAVFQTLGPKIPMRAFFNVTGGLLYFMAFRFAGAGVRELQEAGVMDQTPVGFFEGSDFAAQWLGLFPYVEPLVVQAVLLALAGFALVYTTRTGASQTISAAADVTAKG